MTILEAALLGIVEGITEFLPVSSTAHLVLTNTLLGIKQTPTVKSFEIAIQLGAIVAVLILYGADVVRKPHLAKAVVAGFLPTALIGWMLYAIIKSILLGNVAVILWALAAGSLVIVFGERWYGRRPSFERQKTISLKQAVIIGIAQSLAVIPGVSRSAATIVSGLFLGIDRRAIVEYSFLLAVPTMASAVGYDLYRSSATFAANDWVALVVGFSSALFTAMVVARWFLNHITRSTFMPYALYRILLVLVWLIGGLPLV